MENQRLPSILIVEDDLSWHEIYNEILSDLYDLTSAFSLKEAKDRFQEKDYNLIIVDPGLDMNDDSNRDGIKFIKELSSLPYHPPVIVISARDELVSELNGFYTDVINIIHKEASGFTHSVKEKVEESIELALRKTKAEDRWSSLSRTAPSGTTYQATKKALDQLKALMDATIAHLLVPVEMKYLEIIADTGQDEGRKVDIYKSVTGRAFRDKKLINIGKISEDDDYQPIYTMGTDGVRKNLNLASELAIPIKNGNKILAILNVESEMPNAFNEWHEKLALSFTDTVILLAQNERRQKELEALGLIAQELLQAVFTVDQTWHSILSRSKELINSSVGFFASKRDTETLEITFATQNELVGKTLPITGSISGKAIISGISQRPKSKEAVNLSEIIIVPSAKSIISIPIVEMGNPSGALSFLSPEAEAFSAKDEKLLIIIGNYVRVAFEKMQLYHELDDKRRIEKLAGVYAAGADIVHRLNSPLSIIRSDILMIKSKSDNSLKNDAYLNNKINRIMEKAEEGLKMVDGLKRNARDEFLTSVDIVTIIDSALAGISIPANITLSDGFKITDKVLVKVKANQKLINVFHNLITNAIKAMPTGGVLTISIDLSEKTWITILVKDTGVGIPDEWQKDIFELLSFFSRDKTESGHGLGLWYSKAFIEACGGELKLESQVGKGTTFIVKLLPDNK